MSLVSIKDKLDYERINYRGGIKDYLAQRRRAAETPRIFHHERFPAVQEYFTGLELRVAASLREKYMSFLQPKAILGKTRNKKMLQHRILPRTDLECSSICLGTAGMGSAMPRDLSFRMLDAFLEAGGNFLDSARVYADWLPGGASASEKTVGSWMKERNVRDKIVVATKGAHPPLSDMSKSRMSHAEVAVDIDLSLRCLQSDVIDLYYLHRDDPSVPVEEIVGFLDGFTKEGKIRFYACSNWGTDRIAAAAKFAKEKGSRGFVAVQNLWSLAEPAPGGITDQTLHTMDSETIQVCRNFEISAIPYSSQAGGFFTKRALSKELKYDPARKGVYETEQNYSRLKTAVRIAEKHGVGVTAVVLAYLRCQPIVTVPIIGPGSLDHLEDCLRGSGLILTASELDEFPL